MGGRHRTFRLTRSSLPRPHPENRRHRPTSGVIGVAILDDSDQVFFKAANQTFHQADNLAGQTGYYVRVRAFTGTLTAPEAGEWSASSMGMTGVAPVPTPTSLSAPDDLRSDDRDDDSISLAWDEVTGADGYEVEQREDGGSWEEASCGGGDGTVSETSCVASDLDSGTEYDFRVRALPEDEDENTASDWTVTPSAISTTGTTTTTPTTPTTSGGSGDLNLTWDSEEATVTWYWDLVDRTATYEVHKPDAVATLQVSASPCSGVDWEDQEDDGANRETQDVAVGQVALLCVRPKAEAGEAEADPSWAYATVPAELEAGSETDSSGRTTQITFAGMGLDPGFTYEVRRVSTSPSDSGFDPDGKDCAGGVSIGTETTDIELSIAAYRVTGLSPYTRYGLCYRAANDAGMSAWEVSDNAETVVTLPSAPPSPVAADSTITEGDSLTLEWNVATRGRATVPRSWSTANYDVKLLSMATVNPRETPGDTSTPLVPDIALKHCTEDTGYNPLSTLDPGPGNTQDGFRVRHTVTHPPFDADANDDMDYRLCVRAKDGTRVGPWSIGSRILVKEASE